MSEREWFEIASATRSWSLPGASVTQAQARAKLSTKTAATYTNGRLYSKNHANLGSDSFRSAVRIFDFSSRGALYTSIFIRINELKFAMRSAASLQHGQPARWVSRSS